ncbi:hypothetical protein JW859_03360 [bacterium]|nr:hypothetical protein [bacterium]
MLALFLIGGLSWVLIGLALVLAWYILAPLFTPASLKSRPAARREKKASGQRRSTRGKGRDFEVIEGKGRIIE